MASMISDSHIYIGAWIDWSKGAVVGSTITLPARPGAVLTAFLAFFVTIVGACLWRIVCYLMHQLFATAEARDGIHHQHQVIFRNTQSAAAASRAFAEHAFSWRKTGMKSWSRSLPLAAFATTFMVGFGIASLLTSMVTKTAGSARLVVSDNCGFWAIDDNGITSSNAMGIKDLADTITASNYARTCYGGEAINNGLQCNLFTKKALPYTTNTDAPCPFGAKICNSTAINLDTNRLSSQEDLGINTPKKGRVDFRKVTTCAVLNQNGFVSKSNATGLSGIGAKGDVIRHYSYGGWSGTGGQENDTWQYNQHTFVDNIGYQFEAVLHIANEEDSAWQPIPALESKAADTTIMFLAPNAIQFTQPNNDPFFHANFEVPLEILGRNQTFWISDEWVNVMACSDQYQFCNPLLPESKACTPLFGSHDALANIGTLSLNSLQQTTASLIYYNLRPTSMYYSIYNRGAGALRAQEKVNLLSQSDIRDTHWHTEVTSWFDTALAKLQRGVMSFAAGPEHVVTGSHILRPTGVLTQAMCYSQKISTSSDTTSFSVLGVAIILVVGFLIIGIYLVLEMVIGWFQRRYNWGDYRRLRWIMDDKMQLQRMAFEEAGMGNWSKLSSNVPVTEKDQVFGGLRHVDPEQPRLGEKWTAAAGREEMTGLAAAAAAATSTVSYNPITGRLSGVSPASPPPPPNGEHDKKTGLSVYERPVYHAITPPGSVQGGN